MMDQGNLDHQSGALLPWLLPFTNNTPVPHAVSFMQGSQSNDQDSFSRNLPPMCPPPAHSNYNRGITNVSMTNFLPHHYHPLLPVDSLNLFTNEHQLTSFLMPTQPLPAHIHSLPMPYHQSFAFALSNIMTRPTFAVDMTLTNQNHASDSPSLKRNISNLNATASGIAIISASKTLTEKHPVGRPRKNVEINLKKSNEESSKSVKIGKGESQQKVPSSITSQDVFTSKSHFKICKKKPTNEKSYKCTDCPLKFTKSQHLKSHIMAFHTNERPIICDKCGHKFTQKSNCKSHMKIHTDKYPWKCHQCPSSFHLKSTLHAHYTKIHAQPPSLYD